MSEEIFIRNIKLLGEDVTSRLSKMRVAIFGVGGVGGYACEAIARLGVENITIIDNDVVNKSNFNRQIIAASSTIGQAKVAVMSKRINDINQNAKVEIHQVFFNEDTSNILLDNKFDFVIDAIDSIGSKWLLIKLCLDNNIPFITSLGMGNKIDPSKIKITTLDKTKIDPLARKLREMAKKANYESKRIRCIFSEENPLIKSRPPASIVLVPAVAGLYCASSLLNFVIYGKEQKR